MTEYFCATGGSWNGRRQHYVIDVFVRVCVRGARVPGGGTLRPARRPPGLRWAPRTGMSGI